MKTLKNGKKQLVASGYVVVCLFGCLFGWFVWFVGFCLFVGLLVEHCCGKKKIKDETILERP